MTGQEIKPIQVYWKHMVGGLVDLRIDLGDLSGNGKHFYFGMDAEYRTLADKVERTPAEEQALREEVSASFENDVYLLLSHSAAKVIMSNYMLRFFESEPRDLSDYVTFTVDDVICAQNAKLVHKAYLEQKLLYKDIVERGADIIRAAAPGAEDAKDNKPSV